MRVSDACDTPGAEAIPVLGRMFELPCVRFGAVKSTPSKVNQAAPKSVDDRLRSVAGVETSEDDTDVALDCRF